MAEPGLAKYREWQNANIKSGENLIQTVRAERERLTTEIPALFKDLLEANYLANENFHKLAPSHKKQFLGWINSAKRDETKEKRMREALSLLEQGRKLGI